MKKKSFLTTFFVLTLSVFSLSPALASTDNQDSIKVYSAWNVSFGLIYRGSIHGLYNDQELEVWRDGEQIGIFKLYDVSKTVSSGGFAPFEGGLVLSQGDVLKVPDSDMNNAGMEFQPAFTNTPEPTPEPVPEVEVAPVMDIPQPIEPEPTPVFEPAPPPMESSTETQGDPEARREENTETIIGNESVNPDPSMVVDPVPPEEVGITEIIVEPIPDSPVPETSEPNNPEPDVMQEFTYENDTTDYEVIVPEIEITLDPETMAPGSIEIMPDDSMLEPELVMDIPEEIELDLSEANTEVSEIIPDDAEMVEDEIPVENNLITEEALSNFDALAASVADRELPEGSSFEALVSDEPEEQLPPSEEPELIAVERPPQKDFEDLDSFKEHLKDNQPFDMSQSMNNYGVYLIQEGSYDTAIEWLDSAINKNNSESSYYRNRAVAHYHLNNLKQARADAEKAVDLGDPKAEKLLSIINSSMPVD